MILKKFFGPSTLVAAAFIGPGTVTLCSLAGANAGYTLIFALVFSIIATLFLQEMAARLGLVSQSGLGEAIRRETPEQLKFLLLGLVFIAIVIGNAAYEAGNLSGAVLGMEVVSPRFSYWNIVIGFLAVGLLYFSKYKDLEKILIALVLLMSVCFLITAIWLQPNPISILKGFIPKNLSAEEIILALGLVGTTVVPYNLFLHASTVSSKWKSKNDLKELRIENATAIILGGFVSLCIIITSAASMHGSGIEINNAMDLSLQLEPVLGASAKYIMGIGLFAAGLTSSITAPLAAALCARGIFGWANDSRDKKFIAVWLLILLLGIVFSSLGYKPILIIKVAQIANGVLLPVIACFLLYIMNKKDFLGDYVNSKARNIVGIVIVLITLLIAFKSFNAVFKFF